MGRHGVSPDEVEEVVYDDDLREARRIHSGRYAVFGRTAAGRMLFIVLDRFEEEPDHFTVVTSREMTSREKRALRRYRGKRG